MNKQLSESSEYIYAYREYDGGALILNLHGAGTAYRIVGLPDRLMKRLQDTLSNSYRSPYVRNGERENLLRDILTWHEQTTMGQE